MAKIEFISFGGQDERAKHCSALTINGDIYVINAGVTVPPVQALGITKMIPDFSWLLQNKNRIKGVFLGTPTHDNFGSIEFLVAKMPKIPVFTTIIGNEILKNHFQTRVKNENLINDLNVFILPENTTKKIGKINVSTFRIFNSVPYSLGFCFETPDGNVVYLDEYVFSNNRNKAFTDDILSCEKLRKNNLLLITSLGTSTENQGYTTPRHSCIDFFENSILNLNKRIIFACNDKDVFKVLSIIKICSKRNIPFNVYSNTSSKVYDFILNKKLIKINQYKKIGDDRLNSIDKGVIIITGTPQRLIAKIQKIIDGEDKKIILKETDKFIYTNQTVAGFEKIENNLLTELSKSVVSSVVKMPSSILPIEPSAEDHKMLVKYLRPKYIIPIKGLYSDAVSYINAQKSGFANIPNIIILSNGQQATFENAVMTGNKTFIKTETQYLETGGVLDVAASNLAERHQMAESGVVLFNFALSPDRKTILISNFDPVGVISINESNKKILDEMNKQFIEQINGLLKTVSIDRNFRDLHNQIKKIIVKCFDKKFNKKPIVLLSII